MFDVVALDDELATLFVSDTIGSELAQIMINVEAPSIKVMVRIDIPNTFFKYNLPQILISK